MRVEQLVHLAGPEYLCLVNEDFDSTAFVPKHYFLKGPESLCRVIADFDMAWKNSQT